MARGALGVVAGLASWFGIVMVAGLIMRGAWPAYASMADLMTFTFPMMSARLAISALATLAAGWVTAVIAKRSRLATLMPGVLLLLMFIPQHIMLWDRFPVWYHLTFLLSLVPLTIMGARIAGLAGPARHDVKSRQGSTNAHPSVQ
jgi:ABC-type uncharacterized transport system permease subunit